MYSISRFTFWGICVLILLLPVSRYWRLLAGGQKTTGTVDGYALVILHPRAGEKTMHYANRVEFRAGDSLCTALGPLDYEMAPGRRVPVRYTPGDPSENCVVTFAGFYLTDYTTLPLILLVVWGAFYLSFNHYRRSSRSPGRKPANPSCDRRDSPLNP